MFLNIWSIHRDPSLFQDPLKFDPERFSNSSKMQDFVRSHSWVPFGLGPRVCPGRHLALIELKVLLASIFQRFEVQQVPSQPIELKERTLMLNYFNNLDIGTVMSPKTFRVLLHQRREFK